LPTEPRPPRRRGRPTARAARSRSRSAGLSAARSAPATRAAIAASVRPVRGTGSRLLAFAAVGATAVAGARVAVEGLERELLAAGRARLRRTRVNPRQGDAPMTHRNRARARLPRVTPIRPLASPPGACSATSMRAAECSPLARAVMSARAADSGAESRRACLGRPVASGGSTPARRLPPREAVAQTGPQTGASIGRGATLVETTPDSPSHVGRRHSYGRNRPRSSHRCSRNLISRICATASRERKSRRARS
jgi:hypothetical protein